MNLSAHALGIVDNDMHAFGIKGSRGGYINEILRNYASLSKANTTASATRYAAKLESTVLKERYRKEHPHDEEFVFLEAKQGKLEQNEKQLIETLAAGMAKDAFNEINALPKQAQITIRLQNDVYDYLADAQLTASKNDEPILSSGQFIKAVVEDYATKSYFDREAIIFSDVLETLQVAVEAEKGNRPILQVELNNCAKPQIFDVKPYKLLADIGRNYHYLAGYSRPTGSSKKFNLASFRLSRISSATLKAKSYGSGRITKTEQKAIDTAIRRTGVQYLLGDPQKVVIRLNQDGMTLYNVIIHGRPAYSEHFELEDGTHLLVFDCTEKQITDYFFKFGNAAIIEKPINLAKTFRDKYHAAYNAYNVSRQND